MDIFAENNENSLELVRQTGIDEKYHKLIEKSETFMKNHSNW